MLFPSSLLLCPTMPFPSKSTQNGGEGEQSAPSNGSGNGNEDRGQRIRTDPFLADLARGLQCCFAAIPHAKEQERQQNLLQSVQMAKKMHIALPSNGVNFHLNLCSANLLAEQNEVNFHSDFFLNGILIRLRGQINVRSLNGQAQIEQLPNASRSSATAEMIERERRERVERRLAQMREAALRL